MGSRRGRLYVVGIGPGRPEEMTLRARDVLSRAEVVVGYDTYVRLAEPLIRPDAEVISSGMGGERGRVRVALRMASEGRVVALISGGDPGVYGLASLAIALNVLEGYGVDIEVVPGVTAALAAASLLGAPLNNDFAVISLSDYLIPWEEIEEELRVLAPTRLPLAIYNPSSSRRVGKFLKALEILREVRGGDTPVGVVRNAYREGQEVKVVRLADLRPEDVDMDTILIVGSSRTKVVDGKLITVRGYGEERLLKPSGRGDLSG